MEVRVGAARRPLWAAVAIVVALSCLGGVAFAAGTAVAPTGDESVVQRGDRGATVKRIQRRLGVRPVSGLFGPITERAVRRFQRRRGLTADGVVGPQTRKALGLRAVGSEAAETQIRLPRALKRIAECESGGDPTIVSPDGRYRGKYQFSRSTWRAIGGRGDPAAAPEATQDRLALKLYRRSGTAPWANCA
ncbi:MAG TPA: transglycosylase family protein [Thermoleophilaceae bacterium]|nr:transglycosylase family protein [Thermoleophilaceae bacterium]